VPSGRASYAVALCALCLSALAASAACAATAAAPFSVRVDLAAGCLNSSQVQGADPVVTITCAGRQPVEIRQVRRGDVAGPGGWVIDNRAVSAVEPGSGAFGPLWTMRLENGQGFVEFLVGW
jgi:hypothetical protein